MSSRLLLIFLIFLPGLAAQHRVDPRNAYERIICTVPMVGSGTAADPRRPQYAPWPPTGAGRSRTGILAFHHQVSDDGHTALVEFVARDRSAFKAILAETNPMVKVFVKGKDKREDIEAVFQKHKKNFSLERFSQVGVQ
jgi:hypothetical protein